MVHAVVEPVADFSASPTNGAVPLYVIFTDQSTGYIDTWAWDVDNNGSTDSTEQNPSFVYNSPGTYTVTLTVTGPGGGIVKGKIDYILVKAEPLADFSASPTSGCAPLSVTFTDESTGTIDSWAWDFETDSTEQNPVFTYNNAGTYTVKLTVTDPGGSDVKQRNDYVHVSPSSLTADFSASPTSGCAPLSVTFTDESTGTIDSWAWDFDNDGSTAGPGILITTVPRIQHFKTPCIRTTRQERIP
jgi:PKD repeat protein